MWSSWAFFIFTKGKNMSEPSKMFSVLMPYRVYEQAKGVAKEKDLSVNRLMRLAIEEFLKRHEKAGVSLEK